jgi:hypothetical protein
MNKSIYAIMLAALAIMLACMKDSDSMGDTGTGGSMARFTIKGSYLYTVDHEELHTFNISEPNNIEHLQKQYLGFGIETIFPTENNLFMGARNGMHIYDLSDPAKPSKVSFTPHFVSYDPVVVQGNYAYVTLRSGGRFNGGVNQLLIFDISKLNAPQLITQYDMVNPRGLGIDNDKLFICDDLLKIYQVTEGTNINLIATFDIPAIDVIPVNEHLYVIAEDGFYQYNYRGDTIELISKIEIQKKQ